jgi:hypothetical protein
MLRVYKARVEALHKGKQIPFVNSQHAITTSLLRPCYSTHNLQNRVMNPAFERAEIQWMCLYADRRGLGTILCEKSLQAAKATLREKDIRTTEPFYVKG